MCRYKLLVMFVLGAAVLAAVGSAADSSRELSDGHLRLRLPSGWSGSVGPGTQIVAGRPRGVAWMLAGNFTFSEDAARHEASPSVPPHAVLITIGDFVVTDAVLRWPKAKRLQLPALRSARLVSWHVRFAGRAVRLSVRFGSQPNAALRALANARLASVTGVAK